MRFGKGFLFTAAFLLLTGAGCASTPAYTPPPPLPTPTPTPEPDVPVVTPTPVTLTAPGRLPDEEIMNKVVRMKTDQGDIVIALYPDTAPLAVSNFIYLAKLGYYDGILFHRVCPNPSDPSCGGLRIAQGGDPFTRDLPLTDPRIGTGGPGYKFQDELNDTYKYTRGIVAMANAGPNTNGSQFFLMKTEIAFPKAYTIFGNIIEGIDVVDKLERGSKILSVTVEDAK